MKRLLQKSLSVLAPGLLAAATTLVALPARAADDVHIKMFAPFGVNTESTIHVAIAADKNLDKIFNDAPNVIPDADGNGICDAKDLKAFGVASNIRRATFFINP